MKMENKRLILIAILAVLVFGMQGTVKKESVAAIEGQLCTIDEDCPCWGEYGTNGITAYGIGTARCIDSKCDMTWCYDIEPIADWFKENPFAWMKENVMITFGILAGIGLVLFWDRI